MTTLELMQIAIQDGVQHIQEDLGIDDDWDTTLFLASGSKQISILPLQHLMTGEAAKDIVGEVIIPAAINKTEAIAMGILTTAWTVTVDAKNVPEGETPLDMLVPPSEHPHRKEVLMIMLADQDSQRMMSAEIKRPEGGEHPELGEWDIHDAEGFSGRLWDAPIKALRGES